MASTISKMTTAQVASLTTAQIAALQSTDVAALTPAMIDAMDLNPSDGQFEALTSSQITGLSNLAVAALSSTQLNQLTTATFAALTKTQVAYISTAEISGLDSTHIKALSSVQIPGLTTGEIAHLTIGQISQLSTAAVAALTSTQLGAFAAPVDKTSGADVTGTIAALTPTQFAALASSALPGLDTADITTTNGAGGAWLGITTAQLAALTSKQVPGLATEDLGKFAAAQINALNTAAFSQLTKTQIAAINSTQISGLDGDHLGALTTAQVSGLSAGAMGKLSASQLANLSSDAVGVLSSAQLGALADGVIKGFTADQFASLASSALPGLDAADIASLGDGSTVSDGLLAALTSKQTPGLATADLAQFSADQFNQLDPAAFAALSKTQIAAIATDQIQDLDLDHIGALTSAQISGLSTAAIAALDDGAVTGQIAALPAAAIGAMTADQFNALGPDGVAALTSDQFAALSSKALAGLTAEDVMTYSDSSFMPTAAAVLANVPTLVSSNPMDGAETIAANADIVLTFSEDVEMGKGGATEIITIKKVAGPAAAADVIITVAPGDPDGIVTFSGNTVTINPTADLVGGGSYAIQWAASTILDKQGNSAAAVTDNTTLNFDIAPIVNTYGPLDNATGVATNSNVVLTLSENMKAGTGNIIISSTDGSDVRTISVSDASQVGFGVGVAPLTTDKVTINPTHDLLPNTHYSVQMASGTLLDSNSNPYGIENATTLDFTTATDTTAPTITSGNPVHGAASTPAPNTNIVLTFSEDVIPVAGKNIIIKSDTTNTVVTTIDVTDPQVSVVGKTVTINPTNDLVVDTKVKHVSIDSGAFVDGSGNAYAGLASTTATGLYFTPTGTADNTAPVTPTLTPVDNFVGAVPLLKAAFAVDVVLAGTGNITIRSADGSDVRTFDVMDTSQVVFASATKDVTITPTVALASNTQYSVQIPSGVIVDNYNNSFAGYTDTTSWNFTTADSAPTLVSSSPVDNNGATATPVTIDSNITLNFSEPVSGITAKNITLTPTVNGTAGTQVTIAADDTSQVWVDGKTVTINPTAALLPNATYALIIDAGAFKDVDGTTNDDFAGILGANPLDFKTTDTVAPELTFVNNAPATVGFTGAIQPVVALVFDEVVQAGSGNIIISAIDSTTGAAGITRVIPVTNAQVVFDAANKAVEITPTVAFIAGMTYSVVIDSGVITDVDGNSYTSATVSGAPSLTKIGLGANAVAAVGAIAAPVAGFSGTAEGNNLKLQFTEAVKAGSGDIIISDGAGDTRVIPVTDTSQVRFDTAAQTAMINPMFDLAPGVAYSITMGSGVITDLQGNAYDAPAAPTQGLSTDRLALLTAAQMPGLSADVITALSSDQVVALTPEAIGAMSSAQIAALDPYDVAAMSVEQFAAISTAGIAGLEASDIQALAQTPSATDRIAALTAEQMPKISGTTLAALSTTQIPALTSDAVAALSSAQLNSLTPTQLGHMTFEQFAALSSAAVASLDATDIDALDASNTGQIAAITAEQIAKLSTDAIASFNSTQISALTTEAFAALSSAQLAAIDVGALPGVTTAQISNMTCNHQNFTDAQVMALTTPQLHALEFSTPLVLDLNGNGIDTTAAKDGVVFDLAGDGSAAQVGWVAPSDGLLVLDVNGDGVINDGTEL
ncbi:Ig-like domain-containing protein, partial [Chromatium okenii]|uniref:beta strand repeat-containing protein n=1 Tax=Chromatium okenii TaxID=61644 RepID=UPI0026F00992